MAEPATRESEPERPRRSSEIGPIASLAFPVVLTQLGMMSMGLVDLFMVGRLGKDEAGNEILAGVALGDIWVFGTSVIAMGIVMGLDPIVSQAHGAGDGARIGRSLQRGLVLATVLGAINWWGLAFAERAAVALHQDPELAAIGQRYCSVQGWSLPAFLWFTALRQYLQGRGLMRPALWTILIANLFNVAANEVLIFGRLGFDAMGVEGAGIATGLTRVIMFGGLLGWILLFRLHRGAWVPVRRETFHLRGFSEIFRFGIPVGFQIGAEVWAFQAASLFAGQISDAVLAAHVITLKIASTSFMVPLGIGAAAATRVGNLLGEGRRTQAWVAAWTAVRLGGLVMLISGVTSVLFRHELGRAFTSDPILLGMIATALPVAAAFQVFDGIQVAAAGALRGAGRTLITGIAFLVGFYAIALPTGKALSKTMGLPGIWWGLCLGLGLVAVTLLWDLWRVSRRENREETAATSVRS